MLRPRFDARHRKAEQRTSSAEAGIAGQVETSTPPQSAAPSLPRRVRCTAPDCRRFRRRRQCRTHHRKYQHANAQQNGDQQEPPAARLPAQPQGGDRVFVEASLRQRRHFTSLRVDCRVVRRPPGAAVRLWAPRGAPPDAGGRCGETVISEPALPRILLSPESTRGLRAAPPPNYVLVFGYRMVLGLPPITTFSEPETSRARRARADRDYRRHFSRQIDRLRPRRCPPQPGRAGGNILSSREFTL